VPVSERREVAEEGEASGRMKGRDPFEEEATEQAGEMQHGGEADARPQMRWEGSL
jgi:hypothetical protein